MSFRIQTDVRSSFYFMNIYILNNPITNNYCTDFLTWNMEKLCQQEN